MPLMSRATNVLHWPIQRLQTREGERIPKVGPGSDWRLKLASMKAELLVIAGSGNAAVNMFPGLVHTARHTTKVGNTRSRWANPQGEAAVEGRADDWGEVVTRCRSGSCGWITSPRDAEPLLR